MQVRNTDDAVVSGLDSAEKSSCAGISSESSDQPLQEFAFDSWRGWITVAASVCTLFVYLGVIYSWGIMEAKLVETTSASLTTLTFVGSMGSSFMVSSSILSGTCVRKLGYQKTAFLGGFLMGLGEFLASWTTKHVGALFIFHGIIFGIGGGLSIFACSTAPLRWFKKRRALAMGVVFGGGGLGSAVMSIATNLLVKRLDVAWTFRVLALMLWAVCLPASFLVQKPEGSENVDLRLQWNRFRQPQFLIVAVGTSFSCFPLFIPPYFIPIFARSMGYSYETSIIVLAAWNLASMAGRILGGYTADSLLGPVNSLLICLLLISLSSFVIWPLSYSIAVFSLFIIFNGMGCGAFFSLVPPVVGATFGAENTLGIIPLVWSCWFFGFFFGTPIASELYSLSSGGSDIAQYRPAAYYAGAMSLVGIVFIFVLRLMHTKRFWEKV